MEYRCTKCGRDVGRENLYAKKVSYHIMGRGGRMVKQRTVAWLCRDVCVPNDEPWKQKKMRLQYDQQKKREAAS